MRRVRRAAACSCLMGAGLICAGPAAAQDTHVVVVSGLGGEAIYRDAFHEQAQTLFDAAVAAGVAPDRIVWLAEAPDRDPGRIQARSTGEAVKSALSDLADRSQEGDQVLLILIGHGATVGEQATLNLPGPDLAGAELATWLDPLAGRTVAVVNTASSSGGFLAPLAGPGRIVVTATRSARERNQTRFGEFFAAAFADGGADVDKNERVSLLEAFQFARAEVERLYEREDRMLTEHAMLDDDGDGEGSAEPTAGAGDGRLAASFFLGAAPAALAGAAADDPELARLLRERDRLERDVRELRNRRDSMEASAYEAALEAVLLELAGLNRQIRDREGGG